MRVCPKCGFEDALCWHYPMYHGLEMPYARIEEIELIDSCLAENIKKGTALRKGVLEFTDSHFAYKYSVKSGYVRRRELYLYKANKWNNIPMEKRKRFVKGNQKCLLEVEKL